MLKEHVVQVLVLLLGVNEPRLPPSRCPFQFLLGLNRLSFSNKPLDLDRSFDSLLLSGEPYLDPLLRGDKDPFLSGCNVSESSSESYSFLTHATLKSKLNSLQNAFTSYIQGAIPYSLDFLQSFACGISEPKPGQYCLRHLCLPVLGRIPLASIYACGLQWEIVAYGLPDFFVTCGPVDPCLGGGWPSGPEFEGGLSLYTIVICVSWFCSRTCRISNYKLVVPIVSLLAVSLFAIT
ncbi:MAG: hypothetical protein EZS28_038180 [Streblomastix strix]|uniref:Uncharacterized protein n=1 Tax=Streblomastix strix TaxID=222440 RepID=A0A5J4U7V5_9EUKA|nr:MAG: hypothetical protein EZS28_038180 [Streblomastix strix]